MKKNILYATLITFAILALFLRGFNLGGLPISPYWEEVALGYDAYSIAETGKDHHGTPWPLVAFESFGDWKPSGYFYAAVPSVKLLGLTVQAVRLPSVIAGVAVVVGMFYFSMRIFEVFTEKIPPQIKVATSLVAVFMATFSPWLLQFSRAAWEVNLATAFILWGMICVLEYLAHRNKSVAYLLLSGIFFALAAYTYHSTRVIGPILFLSTLLYSFFSKYTLSTRKKRIYFPKNEFIAGIFFLVLLFPLLRSLSSAEGTQRFAETSIFSDLSIIIESNELQSKVTVPGANLLFHRYVLFGREVVTNMVSHFSIDFLFVHGDRNSRHSTGYTGILFPLDAAFLAAGWYFLFSKQKKAALFLLGWIIVGVLPASVSHAAPHALRILPIAPALLFVLAYGFVQLVFLLSKSQNLFSVRTLSTIIAVVYLLQFFAYWRHYTAIYKVESSLEWQYGYAEVMPVVHKYASTTDEPVFVSRTYGRPAMYYFFYNKIDPRQVQAREGMERMDQSEFVTYKSITFFDSLSSIPLEGAIFVAADQSDELLQRVQSEGKKASKIIDVEGVEGTKLWEGYAVTR